MSHPDAAIGTSLKDKLVAALGVEPPPEPCEVQLHFNRYKKHLVPFVVKSPLPEDIHFLEENFPYLIKLENPNPSVSGEWAGAKASYVLPILNKGSFDQTGFRFDSMRAESLYHLESLLRNPDCIHKNSRKDDQEDVNGISGDHIYVKYLKKKQRKVAFTITHSTKDLIVVVSSFLSGKKWVGACVESPAIYVRPGFTCRCKIEEATG